LSRGPVLRITEVKRAADFRSRGFKWRTIGKMLRRNHSALFKAVRKQSLRCRA
jgi:hypothetical protein